MPKYILDIACCENDPSFDRLSDALIHIASVFPVSSWNTINLYQIEDNIEKRVDLRQFIIYSGDQIVEWDINKIFNHVE